MMTPILKTYDYLYRIGVITYLAFIIMDWLIYPKLIGVFLPIRLTIIIFFILARFFFLRADERSRQWWVIISSMMMGLSLSLMCLLSPDGYACQYYVGLCQITIAMSLLVGLKPKVYIIAIIGIVVQHYLVLSLAPWDFISFAVSLFGLAGSAAITIFVHSFLYSLVKENTMLKGFLPVCANCKKIRGSSGQWESMEKFIEARTKVEFTHGLCPECSEKMFKIKP